MEEILLLLAEGGFVTGEAMSARLGISRMAVHKRIEALKAQGIAIESRHKLGYRLTASQDVLSPVLLSQGLETRWAGRAMLCLPEVDSTNARLKELAAQGAPHGQLVVAEVQHAGRGRRGRGWVSPPGVGLWMSLLVRPDRPAAQVPALTMLSAMAVCDAVQALYGLSAGIKWPNDVILEGKKITGILLELSADMDALHYVVIGTGINVNQAGEDFPEELSARATSLAIQLGHSVPRGPLLRAYLAAFERRYDAWDTQGFSALLTDYEGYSLTLGRAVRVESQTETFTGTARRVGEDGSLYVETEDGETRQVWAGDVSVRGLMGYAD